MAPHYKKKPSMTSNKKRVKFQKSRSPTPFETTKAQNYAEIALHYLSKLKHIFTNSTQKDDSGLNPESKSISKNNKNHHKTCTVHGDHPKRKISELRQAYDIVEAALQYGCAKDIIERVGDYFLVRKKSESKVALRRPTPGPDYLRCSNCHTLTHDNNNKKTHVQKSRSRRRRRTRSVPTRASRTHRSLNGNLESSDNSKRPADPCESIVNNYCSKCYAKLKPPNVEK